MSDIHAVILKCPPGGQFHFGKIALDVDTSLNETDIIPHSDTLFSAIVSTAFKLYGNAGAEAFIDWFEKGELQISSASYCIEIGGTYFYFLPKPVCYDLIAESKKLRKVEFIGTAVWEAGLAPEEWEQECHFIQDRFVAQNLNDYIAQRIAFFNKISLPKVAVHKPGQEDSLYFQTNIQIAGNKEIEIEDEKFTPKSHFYFLVRHSNDKAFAKLKTVLQVIADDGIGGERSVGCGRLDGVEFIPPEKLKDINRIAQTDSEYRVSLSMINPKPEEFAQLKAYKLVTRGGRRIPFPKSSNEAEYNRKSKLKRVRMIGEGALIQGNVGGQVVDITPEGNHQNPFKRSGLAFSLPINLPKSVQDELFD
jgi:CRISPR-associated protein Csm4